MKSNDQIWSCFLEFFGCQTHSNLLIACCDSVGGANSDSRYTSSSHLCENICQSPLYLQRFFFFFFFKVQATASPELQDGLSVSLSINCSTRFLPTYLTHPFTVWPLCNAWVAPVGSYFFDNSEEMDKNQAVNKNAPQTNGEHEDCDVRQCWVIALRYMHRINYGYCLNSLVEFYSCGCMCRHIGDPLACMWFV